MKKNKAVFHIVFVILMLLISVILIGCGGYEETIISDNVSETTEKLSTASSANGENEVLLVFNTIRPKSMTISVGETVTWVNMDRFDHIIASGTPGNPSNLFDSEKIINGGYFSFTFNEEGTYDYFCADQSNMTGKIIVEK